MSIKKWKSLGLWFVVLRRRLKFFNDNIFIPISLNANTGIGRSRIRGINKIVTVEWY